LIAESTLASILNVEKFKVYECSSKDGNYTHIVTVDYDPKKDFIEVPAFVAGSSTLATIAGYSSEFDWFKLSYLAGYQAPVSVIAEVVPFSVLAILHTLASAPIVPASVVLKDASVTMGTVLSLIPMGDSGGGIITGANISVATIDYLSGLLTGSLVTTPQGTITADYFGYQWHHVESVLSEPTLSENISDLILSVREAMHDTSLVTPAFSDDEYTRKIKEAIRRFTGKEGTILTQEYQLSVIILLVRISCCYDMAYETSRYYQLELPDGVKMSRGQVPDHYIKLAGALSLQYKQMVDDMGTDEGTVLGTPTVEVVQCTKSSYFKSGRLKQDRWTTE
jgi:hypothetical protein